MPTTPEDLSPGERAAFETLSRARSPDPAVEERIMKQLRAGGILRSTGASGAMRTRRTLLAAAAAIAIFFAGFGTGRSAGGRSADTAVDRGATYERIRNAGLAYVAALSQIPDTTAVESPVTLQQREAMVSVLGAVAAEVLRLYPDDPLAASILAGLEWRRRRTDDTPAAAQARRVAWF